MLNRPNEKQYYCKRGIELMSQIEDKMQKLMGDDKELSDLEARFWKAQDSNDVYGMKSVHNQLVQLVDQ